MSKISTATVKGSSGEQYKMEVYDLEAMFRPGLGGVYMIARRYKTEDGKFTLDPIYIGEKADLSTLYGFHPKQAQVQRYYPNCKCIYQCKNPDRRKFITNDLIEELEPHCN